MNTQSWIEAAGSPAAKAWAIGLSTWIQEDIPTVSAALLAAAGAMPPALAFAACFLGIWLGDLALYGLARGMGPPLLSTALGRRLVSPGKVKQCEDWFAERGTGLLVLSRFVPGTRLPTYLAAGFLRIPFGRFSAVTAAMVLVWTGAIFLAARLAGPALATWTQDRPGALWLIPAAVAGVWVASRFGLRLLGASAADRAIRLERLRRWEFWPAWAFYLPVALRYVQLAIRHRGWTLPTAANPGMTTGGLVGESKFITLLDLHRSSPEFTAEAWLLPAGRLDERLARLDCIRATHKIGLPFILKPDVGQRGVGVRLVRSNEDDVQCLLQNPANLVIQRYVPGPREAGIFYHRHPDAEHGRIFAITEKIFPEVMGDGVRTVEDLIRADERARLISDLYLRRFASRRKQILQAGERLRLVEAGNHAQGCIFRDGHHLLTPQLEACIDSISRRVPGFFVGRYDLRYESDDELRQGRGFQILELNGAAAEATSIYDARTSLVAAYRTLFRQWEIVFEIGAANRARGHQPDRALDLLRAWRKTNARIRTYPMAD